MAQSAHDDTVLGRIRSLSHEEERLYRHSQLAEHERTRLEQIRVELDQCWDLLRQRRARREFGQDPDGAAVRPANVVEGYEQ